MSSLGHSVGHSPGGHDLRNIDRNKPDVNEHGRIAAHKFFDKNFVIPEPDIPKAPSPLCAENLRRGVDPVDTGCLKEQLERRVEPFMEHVREGHFMCGTGHDELGAHQIVVREIARIFAAKPAEKRGDRRGLLVFHSTGAGKCHSLDTPILMHDGSIKKVQDVLVGDVLMGDDGEPRTVGSLARGEEAMYDIVPSKGETWGCNESHILVLKYIMHKHIVKTPHNTWCVHYHHGNGVFKSQNFKSESDAIAFAAAISDELSIVEIELNQYLELPKRLHHLLKMYRTGVDFPNPQEPCFDPYVIGAWLGDGSSRCSQICTADVEMVNELQRRLEPYDMYVKAQATKYKFSMTCEQPHKNSLIKALRAYDMVQNKHIPHHIKTGTRAVRLQVLAGLLDTDGYLQGNCYEITQKNERLANDIVFVARSLGFLATIREVEKSCTYKDEKKTGRYHRIFINGVSLDEIPTILDRKKAAPRCQIKNALHYGFKVVPKGWGDYYGFTIDGNRRYLLGDFTVTHNTTTAMGIIAEFWKSDKKIVFCTTLKNMKDNDAGEYARNALIFYPEMAQIIFGNALESLHAPRSNWTIAESKNPRSIFARWCAAVGADVIRKKLEFHSFWTLGSQQRSSGKMTDEILRNDGKGSVLIMDEAQNLFHTKDKREQEACTYLRHYLQETKHLGHVVCFPLTATPGDTAEEYAEMLNVVRPLGTEPMTVRDIVHTPAITRGLVSYADIRGDKTHYGEITNGTVRGPRDIQIPIDPRYFAAMLANFQGPTWTKEVRNMNKHPGASKSYFVYTRAGGCALPATAVRSFFSAAELQKLREQHLYVRVDSSQMLLSEKMRVALERARAMPGCQYIYVPDPKVLKAAASSLKSMGMEMVKASTHTEHENGEVMVSISTPKPRFFAFHDGTLAGEKPTDKQMKAMLNFFKSTKNQRGEYLKIFVGTVYEGLDMSWLRGVHLCAPLPTKADDDQAVGRALRYCGHAANARSVAVYRYIGVGPRALDMNAVPKTKKKAVENGLKALAKYDMRGVNTYIREDSERRAKPLAEFVDCIKAQAVDCGVLDAIQFGKKVQCHAPRCDVRLTPNGRLVNLPKGAESPSAYHTPMDSPSSAHSPSATHSPSVTHSPRGHLGPGLLIPIPAGHSPHHGAYKLTPRSGHIVPVEHPFTRFVKRFL